MKAVRIIKNKNKPEADLFIAALKQKLDSLGIRYDDESKAEAVIVLGGDGTILPLAGSELPLLGINFGHTGYMTELEKGEIDQLDALAEDRYDVENRMMIDVFISTEGKEEFFSSALNEAVVIKGAVSRMVDVELSVCGEAASVYSADGLIVATPTGSSAYSMAAGGPIIDPKLELICVTPVCSHSLVNSRSLVFPPDVQIELRFLPTRGQQAFLFADGRNDIEIKPGSVIKIRRSKKTTKLIRLNGHTFCDTLYRKLTK